ARARAHRRAAEDLFQERSRQGVARRGPGQESLRQAGIDQAARDAARDRPGDECAPMTRRRKTMHMKALSIAVAVALLGAMPAWAQAKKKTPKAAAVSESKPPTGEESAKVVRAFIDSWFEN